MRLWSLVWQELRGWYDRKKFYWRAIDDMDMLAACAPPGGGRQELCTRFTRCFSILCMPPPSEHCMRTIFENVLSGHLQVSYSSLCHQQPRVGTETLQRPLHGCIPRILGVVLSLCSPRV